MTISARCSAGRARPPALTATLKNPARLTSREFHRPPGILAPDDPCGELQGKVAELRAAGEIVIVDVGGASAGELKCDRRLERQAGAWAVRKI